LPVRMPEMLSNEADALTGTNIDSNIPKPTTSARTHNFAVASEMCVSSKPSLGGLETNLV